MLNRLRRAPLLQDARNLQLLFLASFLLLGLWYLNWDDVIGRFLIYAPVALGLQAVAIRRLKLPADSFKSALITSFSLTLMLHSDNNMAMMLAAILAIGSKFVLRIKGKHFFNPANAGIVLSMLLLNETWVSPGQWGSAWFLLAIIGSAGIMVLLKAGRVETGFMFLLSLFAMDALRMVVYQGWEWDVLALKYTNGSLLLFSFFMITDPVSTPNHRGARMLWAMGVAGLSFWLQSFMQVHTAPIFALFVFSTLTPIVDLLAKSARFSWHKPTLMRTAKIGVAALLSALIIIPLPAKAFCGFYVAKADAKLFNTKSQVILVRDGDRSVITMNSDYDGPMRDFAMVIPVPVVLQRNQIRVANASLFRTLDEYSGPRLVEYFDENPCYRNQYLYESVTAMPSSALRMADVAENAALKKTGVRIEAKYAVGEYDILILSAKESNGLEYWLTQNGYKIPAGAADVLEPYIKGNMKFFVVKVNLEAQAKTGLNTLRPIQIEFDSPKFMLPIRLGMANAKGDQDMLIYAFSKQGRVECTNYRTVKIPTDRDVPLNVEEQFGKFYKAVFDKSWKRSPDAVFLEYAWNVTPSFRGMKCDPCVGPPPLTADLSEAGVNWANSGGGEQVYFTRLHVRYNRTNFPQDLVFQETPNKESFQGRYVLHHPATGDLSCGEGQEYLGKLTRRRHNEVQNLASLTGWSTAPYQEYIREYARFIHDKRIREEHLQPTLPGGSEHGGSNGGNAPKWIFSLGLLVLISIAIRIRRKSVLQTQSS